jgi:hypothetical protein
MTKAAPALIAPIVGALMLAAMAATQSVKIDYRSASEAQQQKYLNAVARSFERDFRAAAGDGAFVERIDADAAWDAILVDARLTRDEVERATGEQIEDFRDFVYERTCGRFAEQALFETGVTLKIRMLKPSGALLATFNINENGCEPYRAAGMRQDER